MVQTVLDAVSVDYSRLGFERVRRENEIKRLRRNKCFVVLVDGEKYVKRIGWNGKGYRAEFYPLKDVPRSVSRGWKLKNVMKVVLEQGKYDLKRREL
jgi:hypothetical protein